MKNFRLLCFALILTVLTSCGILAHVPPDRVVSQAIAQQQIDMQSAVVKGLNISTKAGTIPDFKVGKVSIESREKLSDPEMKREAASRGAYINELYKVTGTYDATLTKGDRTITQNSPFEVYLGNQPRSRRSTVSAAEATEQWYLLSPSTAQPL